MESPKSTELILTGLIFGCSLSQPAKNNAANMQAAIAKYATLKASNLFLFTSIDDIKNDILDHEFSDHKGTKITLRP